MDNLLLNPGFEDISAGVVGGPGTSLPLDDWTVEFLGLVQSYAWQEADYVRHPDWGPTSPRCGFARPTCAAKASANRRTIQPG